jgi:3-deoxy-D-manno-octulosonic-acid transferase|tara:strand:- start:82 stop:1374 length:1293 start_codon:yes stop_codon:yes gene_type:complete
VFRFFYSLLFYLIFPVVLLRLVWRAIREPAYAGRWLERFGVCKPVDEDNLIWVHAVSAGETIAAVPLIRKLQDKYPGLAFVVTTMTPTGSERVSALLGGSVHHTYAPYDLPDMVNRFLHRTSPQMLILIDTELWPNIIFQCHRRSIPVLLVNGRLSPQSAEGYARVAGLTKGMLDRMAHVAMQSESQARRFESLGLSPERLSVPGSIKFDLNLPEDLGERQTELREKIGPNRLVLIAASTHEGEEEILLDAFEKISPSLPHMLLIIVPRHPDRFDSVTKLCLNRRLNVIRHSQGGVCSQETNILVVDSMGELLYFYSISAIAFVGGSLVPVGGHNMMEAAAFGLPIIMGPHRFHVHDIAESFIAEGALEEVNGSGDLVDVLGRLGDDDGVRKKMGRSALKVMKKNAGGLDRTVALIENHLALSSSSTRMP